MAHFTLPTPNAIRGDQLAAEIQSATGIDVRGRATFIAPITVEIIGADVDAQASAIAAIVAAHVPDAQYSADDRAHDYIASRLALAVGVRLDDLSTGQLKACLGALLWKAGAVNEDGTIRPVATWFNGG